MTAIDLAYVHVVLNHVPVIGLAGGILLLAGALVARSRDLTIAGLVALVLVTLVSLPVYFTGEHAEERVEHLAGVSHDDIEEHEDAAWFAIVFIEIVGAAALAALLMTRRRVEVSRRIVVAILLLSLFTSTVIAEPPTSAARSATRNSAAAPSRVKQVTMKVKDAGVDAADADARAVDQLSLDDRGEPHLGTGRCKHHLHARYVPRKAKRFHGSKPISRLA